jgi:uncharacterized membrane protein YfcA
MHFDLSLASLASLDPAYAVSGLVGGFLVGVTGVGGGSLMTPLLVLFFGIAPSTAVGTDLLYAALTKASGVPVHARKRHIDWRAAGWLAAGSLPAAALTLLVLQHLHTSKAFEHVLKTSVGVALIVTAVAILWRATRAGILSFTGGAEAPMPVAEADAEALGAPVDYQVLGTVVTGILLGCLVTLSSIGAGAVGTVALVFLYPRFPITRIVGTDIAHAVPLTLVAGLGHLALGHVDVALLVNLLVGSIPGIWLGSHASSGIPERWSRPILALLLLVIAAKMIVH